jgi:hypothetical protein
MTRDPLYDGRRIETIAVAKEVIQEQHGNMMGVNIDRRNEGENLGRCRILDLRISWIEAGGRKESRTRKHQRKNPW